MSQLGTFCTTGDGRPPAAIGNIPGDLTLTIEIAYLHRHLPSRSGDLSLVLLGCERFEYLPYEEPALTEPSAIAALHLELLRAELNGDNLSVECADGSYGGTLLLRYGNAVFTTAEGRTLSQGDVEAASERYWTLWEQKASRTNG